MNSKMAIHIYQQLNLKYKISEQVEQKQTHRYREHFDSCQMGGGLDGRGEKVNGLRNTNRDNIYETLMECYRLP